MIFTAGPRAISTSESRRQGEGITTQWLCQGISETGHWAELSEGEKNDRSRYRENDYGQHDVSHEFPFNGEPKVESVLNCSQLVGPTSSHGEKSGNRLRLVFCRLGHAVGRASGRRAT
jgi:hypothetical protein